MFRVHFTCLALVALAAASTPSAADVLEVGIATVDITPPVPWRMSGYFYERISTGVKDPLQAKAVVLRQGDVSAALVFCDLVGMPRTVSQPAREAASRATGIPVENIAVAATHTHTGPLFYGPLRDEFHRRAVEQHGADPQESLDYPAKLAEGIAAAVKQAHASLAPAELSAGFATEGRLSFNRRYHMKDGSVRFNPGPLNPDIVRPAGPIDPQVGLVAISRPGGAPLAGLVAFALHLDTTGGTEYSADYPRFLDERVRSALGEDFITLFGAGTCGDINHNDVRTKEVRSSEAIGGLLGETVAQALASDALAPIAEPSLAVRSATVNAPLQTYTPAEIAAAREVVGRIGKHKQSFLEEVKACSIVALQDYESPSLPLEVQAFRLGPEVALVTLPAEIFVELGLAIKAASPFRTTIVVELANDSLGYIPTKKAFAEGSYETVNSRVQPGVGESLVETAIGLLKELQ